jgi:protocatechuate 3,4-dioxygenase beta subunit
MRHFILVVALTLCASAAACQDGGEPTTAPTLRLPSTPSGCPVPAMAAVDPASVLVPGPSDGLAPTTARGEPMIIVGVVLDPACRPAAGATLNIWHTDSRGLYRPAGRSQGNYYQGVVLTDANGRFRLESIRPAQYPEPGAPPAHVHLELRHDSGRLNSEIIFTTDPAPVTTVRSGRRMPIFLFQRDNAFYGEVAFVLEKL